MVFVISLDNHIERRNCLLNDSYFSYFDINFKSAVNGTEINWESISKNSISDTFLKGRKLTAGEVGCALSHLDVFAESSDADSAVNVFEDDVSSHRCSFVLDAMQQCEGCEAFEIIIFGCQNGLRLHYFWNLYWAINYIVTGRVKLKVNRILLSHIYRTAAYRIGKAARLNILRHAENGVRCADDYLGHARDGNLTIYYVPVFNHPVDLVSSSIENERR